MWSAMSKGLGITVAFKQWFGYVHICVDQCVQPYSGEDGFQCA